MRLIQVFEPAMCCSTGVCGPEVDPALVQFAADLDSLRKPDVKIERFNLSQTPNQFATTPAILSLIRAEGAAALPAILINGRLVHHGSYPDRQQLVALASSAPETTSAPSSMERARLALQTGRSVILCVPDGDGGRFAAPFRSLAGNPAFANTIELIELSGAKDEHDMMTEVGLGGDEPAAVLIVPPGYVEAMWRGSAEENDILMRVLQAYSRCTPGGSCCS